jgi:hypothetical protein
LRQLCSFAVWTKRLEHAMNHKQQFVASDWLPLNAAFVRIGDSVGSPALAASDLHYALLGGLPSAYRSQDRGGNTHHGELSPDFWRQFTMTAALRAQSSACRKHSRRPSLGFFSTMRSSPHRRERDCLSATDARKLIALSVMIDHRLIMGPEAQIRREIRYCDAREIDDLSPPVLFRLARNCRSFGVFDLHPMR